MTQIKLLPYFTPRDLARFCQISKDCNRLMDPTSSKHRLNYQVLFGEQGVQLTPADVEKTKISTQKALKVGLKYIMLSSLFSMYLRKSQRNIGENYSIEMTKTVSFPDLATLASKNRRELLNLSITKIQWTRSTTFGLALSDGRTCKAGVNNFASSHNFDPAKKITRIEVATNKDKWTINRINFYHRHELLVQVGESEERRVRTQNGYAWVKWDGRV